MNALGRALVLLGIGGALGAGLVAYWRGEPEDRPSGAGGASVPEPGHLPESGPAASTEPPPQGRDRVGPRGAFFYPGWAADPESVLVETKAGALEAGDYLHYLAAAAGTRHVDEAVFDMLLAVECRERGIAGAAVSLARGSASTRLAQTDRGGDDADLRRQFVNQALRQMRVEALVQAARVEDERQVQAVFDHRYGDGGVRAIVRHALVSFEATARREGWDDPKSTECMTAAAKVVAGWSQRFAAGVGWRDILAESDDRTARRLLRDPQTADDAGVLRNYNYDRFGPDFAEVVRGLDEGAVGVAASDVGYHFVQVLERVVTRREDVIEDVLKELRARPVTPAAEKALRQALFEGYGYQPRGGDR